MAGVVSGIKAAGVQFIPVMGEDGKPASMTVKLYPENDKPSRKPKPVPAADLDKLEGPAYEAALAKMSESDRAAHLKQD